VSRRAPGVLVLPVSTSVTERVTVSNDIIRLPGVSGALFGLEGQLVASAPGSTPLEVAGEEGKGVQRAGTEVCGRGGWGPVCISAAPLTR
jgi:hypothetical protein